MENEIITMETGRIATLITAINDLDGRLDNFITTCRQPLKGERFITDKEVAERLKIARRTLQDYRNGGILSFYIIGGKVLYAERDIEKLLRHNYHEAYRRE